MYEQIRKIDDSLSFFLSQSYLKEYNYGYRGRIDNSNYCGAYAPGFHRKGRLIYGLL